MRIFIAVGISQAGDHYVIGYWDHNPSPEELKVGFCHDEEFPFVDWEISSLEPEGEYF